MGIKPNGYSDPVVVQEDTVESRYGSWLSDIDSAGQTGSQAITEIDAKASSANEAANELALNATSLPTPDTLMLRDAEGQAKVADPVDPDDAATKGYVDQVVGGGQAPDLSGYVTTDQLPTVITATAVFGTTNNPSWQNLPPEYQGTNSARLAPPPGITRIDIYSPLDVDLYYQGAVANSGKTHTLLRDFQAGEDIYLRAAWPSQGTVAIAMITRP